MGQRATLQIEGGSAVNPQSGERNVGANVVRVNPSAQAGSRSVLVYLQLDRSTGFRSRSRPATSRNIAIQPSF